jgi:hypothetical protein
MHDDQTVVLDEVTRLIGQMFEAEEDSPPTAPRRLPEGVRPGRTPDEVTVHEIRVGRARYPLREPAAGKFQPGREGWTFFADPFLPHFVGKGPSDTGALENWCELIHVSFQRLRATCEIRRTAKEQEQWDRLCELLDVTAYVASCPIKLRQRGEVVRAFPWEVRWAEGPAEQVALALVPDEFAAFEVGDWLEAVLDRHPVTREILYVHEVRPVPPGKLLTAEEAGRFWQSLAQKKDLPESGRDWTKP